LAHRKLQWTLLSAALAFAVVACARRQAEPRRDEADLRRRIDEYAEAIRAMDIERVVSIYAPDIVTFDIVPPLKKVGAAAKGKNWLDVFAAYQPPLGYEIRELTITTGDDIAFARSFNRISGTLKSGGKTDFWLRWTACFRKVDGKWLMVHDHASVPIDVESGAALRNLQP
jgi:ketosteroid isomerase-like protein